MIALAETHIFHLIYLLPLRHFKYGTQVIRRADGHRPRDLLLFQNKNENKREKKTKKKKKKKKKKTLILLFTSFHLICFTFWGRGFGLAPVVVSVIIFAGRTKPMINAVVWKPNRCRSRVVLLGVRRKRSYYF